MEVASTTGRQLKRTVSLSRKPRKKRTKYGASASAGLRRYLNLRGTPEGVYEISRMVTSGPLQITSGENGGWTNGGTVTSNLCFVFTPQYLRAYNDSSSTVWSQWAIPNAAELAALFDDVKIDSVELTFMGAFTQHPSSGATGNITPRPIIYGTDDNDTNTSNDIVEQLGDCKVWYPNNASGSSVMKVTVKPKYNQIIYYTSVLNGYQPARGYVRSDYDIEHYALKMSMVDGFNLNGVGAMSVAAKFNFKFKNLK